METESGDWRPSLIKECFLTELLCAVLQLVRPIDLMVLQCRLDLMESSTLDGN